MSKRLHITIPSPCHEDWQQMTPVDKGRFCASCQKKVHDFSNMPGTKIASILKKESYVCGTLSREQLDNGIPLHDKKKGIWLAGLVSAALAIAIPKAVAQEPATIVLEQNNYKEGKEEPLQKKQFVTVKGVIYDTHKSILPATIRDTISHKTADAGTDGHFVITTAEGNVLEVSCKGYRPQYITVNAKDTTIAVYLDYNEVFPIGEISYRRSFFGRIFQSMGNLFRKDR